MTVSPAVSDLRSASPVNMASAITAAPALVPPTATPALWSLTAGATSHCPGHRLMPAALIAARHSRSGDAATADRRRPDRNGAVGCGSDEATAVIVKDGTFDG